MPNVTIDITGRNAGGAQPTTPDNGRTTRPGGDSRTSTTDSQDNRQSPIFDPNARLMDDLRRMLIEQASTYQRPSDRYTPIISQIEQAQRQQIANQYEERRQQAQQRMTQRYSDIDRDIDESIDREISTIDDDDEVRRVIDRWEGERDRRYETAGRQYDDDIAAIEEEQTQKEEELSRTIEELTEEIRRSGGNLNPNSFLSQLREQRQQAIIDRDTAEDEETARQAAARVRELEQQIRNVERGEGGTSDEDEGINWGTRALQTMLGFDQIVRGITSKDAGSLIMGGAQGMLSMFGANDETTAKTLAWIKPIATIGTLFTQLAQKEDQTAGLAALLRADPTFGVPGGYIRDVTDRLIGFGDVGLWNYKPSGFNFGISNIGLSSEEFAASAERRISQRGFSEGGVTETFLQEMLERVFSLNRGDLGVAGRYDRYGTNASEAISQLVSMLERTQNSGVTQGNYARVQEYFGIQQQIMQQMMRFSNAPNYGTANKMVEAMANVSGYNVDSRTAGHVQEMTDFLINPRNDRQRMMLYDVVEQLVPKYYERDAEGKERFVGYTAGNVSVIDQVLNDPEYQGMILRGYLQKIQSLYGGFDSNIGYGELRSMFPNMAPQQMKMIVNSIANGRAGDIMASRRAVYGSENLSREYVNQAENYVSEVTQGLSGLSDGLFSVLGSIDGGIKKVINGLNKLVNKF